jgi:hypothetical protein
LNTERQTELRGTSKPPSVVRSESRVDFCVAIGHSLSAIRDARPLISDL